MLGPVERPLLQNAQGPCRRRSRHQPVTGWDETGQCLVGPHGETVGRRSGISRVTLLPSPFAPLKKLLRMWGGMSLPLQRLPERPYRTLPGGILQKFLRRLSQFPLSFLGAYPTLTFLLRRTICGYLRRSRPEKILNVFQRIRL